MLTQKKRKKNSAFDVAAGQSKTRRNFTTGFGSIPLPERIMVNVDTFQVLIECVIPEPVEGQKNYWITDITNLEWQLTGTPFYKHLFKIYHHGEEVGYLLSHPRLETAKQNSAFGGQTCKLEIANHVLYSKNWLELYEDLLSELRAQFRSISRLDIALDGVNHLPYFLNMYFKQSPHNKKVELKGKATLDPGIHCKNTMMFDHFKIGKGAKQIKVYNKTSEIEERSQKEYIYNLWKQNNFDLSHDVWRCELRLNSQGVKSFKGVEKEAVDDDGELIADPRLNTWEEGVDLKRIDSPHYLLMIFRTCIKNFFEFVTLTGQENISREPVIDLFGFELREVGLLEKIPRQLTRGAYKAKMAIHNAIANVLLRHIDDKREVEAALQHVRSCINLYDLGRYFRKKIPKWTEQYQPSRPPTDDVTDQLRLLAV